MKLVAVAFVVMLFPALVSAEEAKSVALIDDIGREVAIARAPERIVSLSPSNTEILFALGLGDRVVGVTQYCNYPPEVESSKTDGRLAVVGGYSSPDIEKIISLNPDLVLASRVHGQIIPRLEEAGIPAFVVCSKNLSGIVMSIDKVGRITGRETQASDLTRQMEIKIRAVSERVENLPRMRTLYVVWHDPLKAAGAETFEDEMIVVAGGINIFGDLSGYSLIDLEAIAARNPEVIVICSGMGSGEDSPLVWARTEPCLNGTDARINSRIYEVDGNLVTRAGPRIVEALEMFAVFIHPEAF